MRPAKSHHLQGRWWATLFLMVVTGLSVQGYLRTANPLAKYELLYRGLITLGLIIVTLSVLWVRGRPLQRRMAIYYGVLLPVTLALLVVLTHSHWFTQFYFTDLPLRVSPDGFLLQTTPNSCTPTAMANLMRLYGIPATEGELAVTMQMGLYGSSVEEIDRGFTAAGWEFYDTTTQLPVLVANARPCLVSIRLPEYDMILHSCTLLAITDTRVYVVDPLRGQRTFSHAEFLAAWTGQTTFAIPPGAPVPYDFRQPFALSRVGTWLPAFV